MSSRFELRETRLPSGLRVVCAPLPHTHRAAVTLHVSSGSRFEPPELGGVSHFLEHMLHRGTERHRSAHALALAFEELGSELGAATYVDHAVLSAGAPPAHLDAVIALLGDVVRTPMFTGIDIERGIVREEILESLNEDGQPVDADELTMSLAFPDHGLGRPIAGTIAALNRFDVPTLQRFHAAHYAVETMVVSVAGPIDEARVLQAVDAAFAGLPSAEVPHDAPPTPAQGPRFGYVEDAGSQTALRVTFRAPSENDALEPAAELLLRVLDDGMSTRLYHRVCDERGLAYDVSAAYEAFADTGLFSISSDCAHGRAEELLSELFAVAREVREGGPEPRELEKAKRRFSFQMQSLFDDPLELAAFVGLGALTGVARTPEEREAQLLSTTASDVARAARAVFTADNLVVAAVGQLTPKRRRALERLVSAF